MIKVILLKIGGEIKLPRGVYNHYKIRNKPKSEESNRKRSLALKGRVYPLLKGRSSLRKLPREIKICMCGCGKTKEVILGDRWKRFRGHKDIGVTRKCIRLDCNNFFVVPKISSKKYCGIRCSRLGKSSPRKGRVGKKFVKSVPPWNKGLTKETDSRVVKNSQATSIGMKKRYQDPVYMEKFLATHWSRNENIKDEVIRKCLRNSSFINKCPNKLEMLFNNLLQDLFPNEYKYVGTGEFILAGKCPDFINFKNHKIIELFGDYWHSEKRTGISVEQHVRERTEHFAKYGYRTLIVWEHELNDLEKLKIKLIKFCENREVTVE